MKLLMRKKIDVIVHTSDSGYRAQITADLQIW